MGAVNEAKKCVDRMRRYLVGTGAEIVVGDAEPVVDGSCVVRTAAKGYTPVGLSFRDEKAELKWFAEGSLDYVFAPFVLQRLSDWKGALDNWMKPLKPGGYLVLYVPHGNLRPKQEREAHALTPWDVVRTAQRSWDVGREVVHVSSHLFGDEWSKVNPYKHEYAFEVVVRKKGQEPEWAQPRLMLPPEIFTDDNLVWSDEPVKVLHVADRLDELPSDIDSRFVSAELVRDEAHILSKAAIATADVVFDTTSDRCAAKWAASFDVDGVYTSKKQDDLVSLWPRQANVSSREEGLEKVRACMAQKAGPRPGVSVCMIVKNEKKHLPNCLSSMGDLPDELIIVDTGSTDETPDIAREAGALVYFFPWRNDFGWARNRSLERARHEWSMWIDADDTFLAQPEVVREYLASVPFDAISMDVQYGTSVFVHTRFLRTNKCVRFYGMGHEYPVVDNCRKGKSPFAVSHSVEHTPEKNRVQRNIDILELQVHADPKTPRWWFYLGNSYRDGMRYEDAIECYDRYFELAFWQDEIALAWRRKADCLLAMGKRDESRQCLMQSLSIDPRWAETYFELGSLYMSEGKPELALKWFFAAVHCEPNPSPLFQDPSIRQWKAKDSLAKCYEKMGDVESAITFAEQVAQTTGQDSHVKQLRRFANNEESGSRCCFCGEKAAAAPNAVGPDYAECKTCGVLFPFDMNPVTDEDLYQPNNVMGGQRWAAASEYLAGYAADQVRNQTGKEKLKVLEIMPAYPALAMKMAELGHDVTVVDLSPKVAEIAKDKPVKVVTSKWESFEVPEDWKGTFDLIVLVHAMDHLPSLVEDMHKAASCLKPDGRIFSRHPDADSPGVEGRHQPREIFWVLTERSTQKLAEALGMEVEFRRVKDSGGEADVWFKMVGGVSSEPEAPAIHGGQTDPMWVGRPGSFGDVLMTTYAVRELKRAFPRRPLHYVVHPGTACMLENNPWIDELVLATEVPQGVSPRWFEYPVRESACAPHRKYDYPNQPLPRHLVDLFAECVGISKPFESKLGSLVLELTREEESFGLARGGRGTITLQTGAGWSQYKEWPQERWAEVCRALIEAGHRIVRIGMSKDPCPFEGQDKPESGYEEMLDVGPRRSAAIMKHSDLHLGIDSLYNHVTNAVRTPGVILWGSTHPQGSGYAHNRNVVVPPPQGCQPCYIERPEMTVHPKPPCPNEHVCMTAISSERITKIALETLEEMAKRRGSVVGG